jgi:glycerol uptake facilitator-like aquaporin
MKDFVIAAKSLYNAFLEFLPPGIFLSFSASYVGNGKYFDVYVKEFIGTMLMIVCTFSAGKWWGVDSIPAAWACHVIGVVTADYLGGGQQVNPMVTMSILALGKCDFTEAFVRVAGQMGGGLIAFPLYHAVSEALNLTPFGGPAFKQGNDIDAAISEFGASFFLCWAIYIVSVRYHVRGMSGWSSEGCHMEFFLLIIIDNHLTPSCNCSSIGSSTLENTITLSSKP